MRITVIYFIVASLWILFSDVVVAALFQNVRLITQVQTYKGFLFVVVTSGLLFLLVYRGYQAAQSLST